MNTYVKIVLSVGIVSMALQVPMTGFAALPEKTLTFSDAWKTVRTENDALLASREEVKQAEHKQDAAKELYLPEVGISASYIYLDDAVELTPEDVLDSMEAGAQVGAILGSLAQSYGISPAQLNSGLTSTIAERDNVTSSVQATWPLYTGGRINAAQDIAAGQVVEAKNNLQLQLLGQFENLVRYYFGTVLAKQVYETRLSVETGLKKHRDHAVLLEQQGQIAKVERMQAEASLDKAVVERRKARRDLEIAGVALSRMLKSAEPVMPSDNLFISENLPAVEQFITQTMNNYPGLGVLDSKKEQATGLVKVEKGKYFPTVAAFGRYSLYEEDDLATKLAPDWLVGVGVNIPIVDRSGRSGNMQAAKSTIRRIDHLKLQAKSDLSVLVEQTYRQAEQALEEYRGLGSSQQLAEETVSLRNKAFGQGLSTSLDVVDAELFLAGVKTQRAVAVYNYVVSLGRILAVSCEPEKFFMYQNTNGIEGH